MFEFIPLSQNYIEVNMYFRILNSEHFVIQKSKINEEDLEKSLTLFNHFSDSIFYNENTTLEDLSTYLHKKTNIDYDFIINIIEPFIFNFNDQKPFFEYYEIFKYENGKIFELKQILKKQFKPN